MLVHSDMMQWHASLYTKIYPSLASFWLPIIFLIEVFLSLCVIKETCIYWCNAHLILVLVCMFFGRRGVALRRPYVTREGWVNYSPDAHLLLSTEPLQLQASQHAGGNIIYACWSYTFPAKTHIHNSGSVLNLFLKKNFPTYSCEIS